MAHPSWEIPIGGADALERSVHPTESIDRPAQASGATGVFSHLHAGIQENLPDGLFTPPRGLQVVHDFGRGGNAEGVNDDALAAQHAGEFEKVAGLAPGAGADISPAGADRA